MGEWRPTKAAPYSSDSMDEMKETLAEAIRQRLISHPSAEAVIKKTVKSCRPSILRDFRDGDGALYGLTRLTQIAEALGYSPEITFRKSPNDNTQTPGHGQNSNILEAPRRASHPALTADGCLLDVPEPDLIPGSLRYLRRRTSRAWRNVHGSGSVGPENDDSGGPVQCDESEAA